MNQDQDEDDEMRLLLTEEINKIRHRIVTKYQTIQSILESSDHSTLDRNRSELKHMKMEYMYRRNEIKQYLPNIRKLLTNDTLFVIVDVHGEIKLPYEEISVPPYTNLFKLMDVDYGSTACIERKSIKKIKTKIMQYISNRREKNTRKNNIKFIKKILSNIIPYVKQSINNTKEILNYIEKNKSMKQFSKYKNWSNQEMSRYALSTFHIHNPKHIIKKLYAIKLYEYDTYDKIHVIHPKYKNINLIDYVDTELINDYLVIKMQSIFDLFQTIKYVLYIDTTCSIPIETNNVLNQFKQNAKEVEGNSITQHIINYNNSSPYNGSIEYEQEQQKIKENINHFYDEGWNTLKQNRAETRRKLPLWRRFSLF